MFLLKACICHIAESVSVGGKKIHDKNVQLPPEPPGKCSNRLQVRNSLDLAQPYLCRNNQQTVMDVPKINFQQTHVCRHSVMRFLLRPADWSHPLHYQPCTCLHTIGIALLLRMSMSHQSASSHDITTNAIKSEHSTEHFYTAKFAR